ncbi:MAG: carbohydrate kinase [Clostridiales bacterium]|nr:carbohydrate kinase [Clostridiales bacterium]
MIISIGEILADMVGESVNGTLTFKSFCGGAPFNVAVNAKNAGAKVGFIGRVGKDPIGKFLIDEAGKAKLDNLEIQIDGERNTTLAFVTLKDGERDFAFYRHDTADFNVELDSVNFANYKDLNIVHLGSLMLSEENGKILAQKVVDKARSVGAKVSFDLNFRMDIYRDFNDALSAFKPFVEQADIIKFSDDELRDYTGLADVIDGVKSIYRKDTLVVVTLGSKGSLYYINGENGMVPTEKVKPIDTTGAGDAFFGTLLANLENKEFTKENIESALVKANKAGADTTQFLGAIKL